MDIKGLITPLFDFEFKDFVIPKVLKFIYMAMIGIATFFGLLSIITALMGGIFGGLFMMIIAPILLLFQIFMARMFIELSTIAFRSIKLLESIDNHLAGGSGQINSEKKANPLPAPNSNPLPLPSSNPLPAPPNPIKTGNAPVQTDSPAPTGFGQQTPPNNPNPSPGNFPAAPAKAPAHSPTIIEQTPIVTGIPKGGPQQNSWGNQGGGNQGGGNQGGWGNQGGGNQGGGNQGGGNQGGWGNQDGGNQGGSGW